jgi:hypothetical protein
MKNPAKSLHLLIYPMSELRTHKFATPGLAIGRLKSDVCVHPRGRRNDMKRAISPGEKAQLAAELERLPTLSLAQLDERWRELFGGTRPPRIYGELLVGVLAYRLQEQVLGGLKPSTRRLLRQVDGNSSKRRPRGTSSNPQQLKSGSVFLREWHGMSIG